jgi:hypothetical protein
VSSKGGIPAVAGNSGQKPAIPTPYPAMKLKEVSEMVKKTLLVLALAACAAGMAFAQPEFKLSAGAGIIGANTWAHGKFSFKDEQLDADALVGRPGIRDIKYSEATETTPGYDFGGFLFFDATYAEFDVMLGIGKLSPLFDYDAFKLALALYVKYPFAAGDSGVTIAPILGAQFDMALSAKDAFGNEVKKGDKDKGTGVLLYDGKENGQPKFKNGSVFDFSTVAIKLGVETKAPLAEKLYLSAQALWGITFDSVYMTASKKLVDDFLYDTGTPKLETFTHGVTFKVGVGCTF